MSQDPLFALPGYWDYESNPTYPLWIKGDYHLLSQAGRWDPMVNSWISDIRTSPCINRGDPSSPCVSEPVPNGRRLNLGAYGGTGQASSGE